MLESNHKDVYAYFGLASYLAQCFEMDLGNILLIHHRLTHSTVTLDDLLNLEKTLIRKTLGPVLSAVRKVVSFDPAAETLLETALLKRNYLTHHYFREHAVDMLSHDGRAKMISELQDICDVFRDVGALATVIARATGRLAGITDAIIEDEFRRLCKSEDSRLSCECELNQMINPASVNNQTVETDERYMRAAIEAARIAEENGDVPIGVVIVYKDQIIAKAYNQREQLQDPTAHAEIIALTQAAAALENWHLNGCTIYVTLEPCPMCAGALVLSRMDRLVYGCDDPKTGACKSLYNIVQDERLNHRLEVTSGILADECKLQLQNFFEQKRATKNNELKTQN